MESNNSVACAVRRALLTGAATIAVAVPQVQAQQNPDDQQIEEITVTGTRIRQRDLTAISPVKSVTAEDFKMSGTTRVEDLIGNLPQAIADFGGLVSNGATGSANVDLRGLGSQRTLVLVNGRRLMPGDPTQNGNAAPDLNQIPGSLIERVEVLTGGASAVYGADAVSGVVNFIMQDDFEGARLDVQTSGYQHNNNNGQLQDALRASNFEVPDGSVNDGTVTDVTFTLGVNSGDGRGNATMYVGYRDIQELLQGERDYSACAIASGDALDTCFGSSTASPGRFQQVEQSGEAVGAELASSIPMTPRGANDALIPFLDEHLFNYAPYNHYQRPDERWTAGVFGHFDLSEKVTAYGEFQFMDDRTDAQIAPSAAFRGSGPPSLSGAYTVNCDNPFLEADMFDYVCTQQGLGAGDDALISIGRRLTEGGGRSNSLVHTSYRSVAGLRGDITDNWSYDAYALFGTTNYDSTYINDVSLSRLGNSLLAVDSPTGPVCRINADADPSNDDALCVPIDIFHSGTDASDAAIGYISVPAFQNGRTRQMVVSAAVTGDLTDAGVVMPGASEGLGLAFGAEYRKEQSELRNDILFSTGGLVGQGGAVLDTDGEFAVKEVFTEARLPLVQDKAFAQSISVEGGYRYSDYDLGFTTDTWKLGADWEPADTIRFRSSLQRAVRAPNIQELFRPQVVQLDGNTDPCAVDNPGTELPSENNPNATLENCMRTGVTAAQYGSIATNPASQYNGLTGGNPNLEPETADTFSVGFVLTPSFVDGLSVTMDWYDIKVEDVINGRGADLIVNTCMTGGDPLFCDLVHRAPGSGSLWLGQQGYVEDLNENLGSLKATGIDTEINYDFDLPGKAGGLGINFVGNWVDELTTEPLPGFPKYDCAGLFGNVCGRPVSEWRHKARFSWTPNEWPFDVNLTWRHVGAVDNENKTNNPNFSFNQYEATDAKIKAFDYFDLAGAYSIDSSFADFTIRVGVNNVTDKEPPIIGQDIAVPIYVSGNTYPQNYDVLGRYWFVNVTADF